MTWNFNIDEAPKSYVEIATKPGPKGADVEFKRIVYRHIIAASSCGKVTRSYWVPKDGRWCMFSVNSPPIAWMPWPEHPEAQ